jgi:hypothetical protein
MKTTLTAIALAATLIQPASAITFPSLTTIYVGSGIVDSGGPENAGFATIFNCSNVSGVTATVRFLILSTFGVNADKSVVLPHGETVVAATDETAVSFETLSLDVMSILNGGVVNIESTQSGVFCNAIFADAAGGGFAVNLPLVRVNPHPGTVE